MPPPICRSAQRSTPVSTGWRVLVVAALLLAGTGCSIRQMAIRQLGSALAGSAGGAFAAESDVEFAGQAVPFSLKLIESLLHEQPDNPDLLLAAASGFTQYAYVWVQQPADFIEADDFAEARRQRARARDFFLRAHHYAVHALAVRHREFAAHFSPDPNRALATATAADVPLLYWAAASLGSAITLGKTEPELVARQTQFAALLNRALAIDPEHHPEMRLANIVSQQRARWLLGRVDELFLE